MENKASSKSSWRSLAKEMRNQFSDSNLLHISEEICQKIEAYIKTEQPTKILLYLSMKGEISLESLIKKFLAPENYLFYAPVISKKTSNDMNFFLIDTQSTFKENSFLTREPIPNKSKLFSPELHDNILVIIPSLALDLKGNRLGYGKGYYDKFLTQLSQQNGLHTKLAPQYDKLVVSELPHEAHDQKMDCIITEKRVLDISPKKS